MARENIAPTKSSLLRMKEQLALAEEGHDLLDQKRELLVRELMELLKEVRFLETELEGRRTPSYNALEKLLLTVGRIEAASIAALCVETNVLRAAPVARAGLAFWQVEVQAAPSSAFSSNLPGLVAADLTALQFKKLLETTVKMATLTSQVKRLAKELKKTQRRVNALEKIVIPQVTETIVYIQAVLEEKDREAFFVSKLLKRRIVR